MMTDTEIGQAIIDSGFSMCDVALAVDLAENWEDPATAVILAQGGLDFTPWPSYTTGAYVAFLPRAEEAMAALSPAIDYSGEVPPDLWMDPRIPAGLITVKQGTEYTLTHVYFWAAVPADSPESRGTAEVQVSIVTPDGLPVIHAPENGIDFHTHDGQNHASGWTFIDGIVTFGLTGYFDVNDPKHFPGPHDLTIGDLEVDGFGLNLNFHVMFGLRVEQRLGG